MHEVGPQLAQAPREARGVGQRVQRRARCAAAEAHGIAAHLAGGCGEREHLDRDPRFCSRVGQQAVLAEDHVRVHIAKVGQQAQDRDLAAGQSRHVVEVDDPQALVALARGKAPVERAVALGEPRPREALGVVAGRGSARQAPAGGLAQARGERRRVRRRHDQRGVQRGRHLRQAADVGDDARRAAGGGLEHHQAEPLERERGRHRDVGGAVDVDQLRVGEAPEHPHAAAQRRSRSALGELAGERPVADQQQRRASGQLGRDPLPRVEQVVDPHARDQAPHACGDERARLEPESLSGARSLAGGEDVEGDAGRPHVHAPR